MKTVLFMSCHQRKRNIFVGLKPNNVSFNWKSKLKDQEMKGQIKINAEKKRHLKRATDDEKRQSDRSHVNNHL